MNQVESSFPRSSQIRIFGLLLAILLFWSAFHEIKSVDAGWHLRYGEEIWQYQQLLQRDHFSYTAVGKYYPPTHWLFQIIIYGIYHLSGFIGLLILKALWYCLAYMILYYIFIRLRVFPLMACFLVFMVAIASVNRLAVRPHGVSFLFFISYLAILSNYRQLPKHWSIWILPPIMLLWANMHAGCIFGTALLGLFWLAEVLNTWLGVGKKETRLPYSALKRLFIVCILTACSSLITPSGMQMYIYLFKHLDLFSRLQIAELRPPTLSNFSIFWGLIAVTSITLMVRWRNFDLTELILLVPFLILANRTSRLIPYFAILASWSLAKHWRVWTHHLVACLPRRLHMFFLLSFSCLFLIGAVSYLTERSFYHIHFGFDRKYFPVDAVKFLRRDPLVGRMYNSNALGGYLIWEYREKPVYSDGRMQLYSDILLRPLNQVLENDYHPVHGHSKYPKLNDCIWICMLRYRGCPDGLPREKWALVYFDAAVQIYIRRPPALDPYITAKRQQFYQRIQSYIQQHEFRYLTVKNQSVVSINGTISSLRLLSNWGKAVADNPNNTQAVHVLYSLAYQTKGKNCKKTLEILYEVEKILRKRNDVQMANKMRRNRQFIMSAQ